MTPLQSPGAPRTSGASFVVGAGLAGLMIVAWLITGVLGATRAAQLKEAQSRLVKVEQSLAEPSIVKTERQYAALQGVIAQSQTLRDQRFLFMPAWRSIKESVPADLQITALSLTEDRTFRLTGNVKSLESFARFSQSLTQHAGITNITPLGVEKKSNGYSYQLSFQINSALFQGDAE